MTHEMQGLVSSVMGTTSFVERFFFGSKPLFAILEEVEDTLMSDQP